MSLVMVAASVAPVVDAFSLGAGIGPPMPIHQASARGPYFPETGYAIDEPHFADYFKQRGGASTFGFPISRTFQFLGLPTQFFQRIVLQIGADGAARPLNLLDPGMMGFTRINGSTFPAPDDTLSTTAPSPRRPDYATAVVEFVRRTAPDTYNGQPVAFFTTFMDTVSLAEAFPNGGDVSLLPLINLEIWGVPTSAPAQDPNNNGFIYQRFQRGIMHYDAVCRCTQALLLGDHFKSLLTGENLPPDLEQQARASVFLRQYAPDLAGGPRRPGLLPDSDLTNTFVTQPARAGEGDTLRASAVSSRAAAVDVPLRSRLRVARGLEETIDALEGSGAAAVIDALLQSEAEIAFGPLPTTREYARYLSLSQGQLRPPKRSIVISSALSRSDPKALAALIVHEGAHLKDDLAGRDNRTVEACFQFEIRAFAQQSLAWQAFYGPNGKPQPKDELDTWLNSWLATHRQGSNDLDKRVREFYRQPRPTGCLP